jgi:hypothetical protein
MTKLLGGGGGGSSFGCCVFCVVVVSGFLATNDTYFLESCYQISQNGQFLHNQNRTSTTKPTKCYDIPKVLMV